MRIACWIPEVTNTHSEYIILIALPVLRYMYIACLVSPYLCRCTGCFFLLFTLCTAVTFTTSINNVSFPFLYELLSTVPILLTPVQCCVLLFPGLSSEDVLSSWSCAGSTFHRVVFTDRGFSNTYLSIQSLWYQFPGHVLCDCKRHWPTFLLFFCWSSLSDKM